MKDKTFGLIISFLPELEPMLDDPEVSEIIVMADGSVAVERNGKLEATGIRLAETQRNTAAKVIARRLFDEVSAEQPLLDSRLPDGSRIAIAMPPASVGGTHMNIRKFRMDLFSGAELVRLGMLTAFQLAYLFESIRQRESILISGPPGAGKTTLLNALAGYFPETDNAICVEDTAELVLKVPFQARLEARRAQMDGETVLVREVSMRALLRQVLRMRPDRLIVGEVRGGEAFDLLRAANVGAGVLTSIHSNSAADSVEALRTCVAMAGENLPDLAIARSICQFRVLVHVTRIDGHRRVAEILRLGKYSASSDSYQFEEATGA